MATQLVVDKDWHDIVRRALTQLGAGQAWHNNILEPTLQILLHVGTGTACSASNSTAWCGQGPAQHCGSKELQILGLTRRSTAWRWWGMVDGALSLY